MGLSVSLEVGRILVLAERAGYRAEVRTASTSLAMLAAMRRASSQASSLFVTHQPQELGFVNVAVFDEAGD
jgi:hypothetical protein